MASSCSSICFGTFLLVSTLLYLGELAVNGVFVYLLYFNEDLKIWFLPCVGLLLLPLVTVQLVSAILLLTKKAEVLSVATSAFTAVLHILQLGFLWRHQVLFRERDPVCRSNDLSDFHVLNILHTFTSLIPLLLIQTYLLLQHNQNDIILVIALIVTLTGSCWNLVSFRKHIDQTEDSVLEWPGTIFKLLWRLGEIVSRVISLTVFATVHFYWIFVILGLHGITMLVCLCTSVLGNIDAPNKSRCKRLLTAIGVAYIYTFCFINLHSYNSQFRYTLYYVIMFFENAVLTAVWYINDDKQLGTDDETLVFISGIAFFTSIVSMVIYFKCFHLSESIEYEKHQEHESDDCINCKLSFCSKHNIKLQRPFSTGWLSQYQQALGNGNYYKNLLHDPLLDSEWESEHDMLNSSGEHCQIRDTDLESIRTNEKRQFTSVQASGTYTHKRFFNIDSNAGADTESVHSGSGIYNEDWRQNTQDNLLIQLSVHDSLSLLSSRTQLLTDSWDNLKASEESVGHKPCLKKIDILNSLIRKDLDTSFISDGYTTDHTLDSYQLPVTVLAKKRSQPPPRKFDIASSTASESTDCTICAFMNQTYSSPESIRRRAIVQERIDEESPSCIHEREKDPHMYMTRADRRQKPKLPERANRTQEKKHRQKCDRDKIRVLQKPSNSINTPNTKAERDKTKPVELSSIKLNDKQQTPKHTAIRTMSCISGNVPVTHKSAFKVYKSVPDARDFSDSPLVCASDSGDSAFPRHTPLSVYLAAADNDHDGNSESSCEMII